MKFLAPFTALVGLAILIALIAYFGYASVLKAVANVGWGAALVVAVRAISLCGAGAAWWLLLTPGADRGIWAFIGLRFIREAINTLVPVAQVGGDLIAARLLRSPKINGSLAVASVLIDIFVQVVTLAVFALIGFGIVVDATGSAAMTDAAWGVVAFVIFMLTAFFLVLNFGASEPVIGWITALAERRNWNLFRRIAGLGWSLQQVWKNRRGLYGALALHFFVWFLGAMEVWIALHFIDHPVTYAQAVAIEALGHAGRAAGFAIPGGLGVQDGALIAASAIFGVPADAALAVALVKRIADLVLGVPSLLAWQALEGHRFLRYRK